MRCRRPRTIQLHGWFEWNYRHVAARVAAACLVAHGCAHHIRHRLQARRLAAALPPCALCCCRSICPAVALRTPLWFRPRDSAWHSQTWVARSIPSCSLAASDSNLLVATSQPAEQPWVSCNGDDAVFGYLLLKVLLRRRCHHLTWRDVWSAFETRSNPTVHAASAERSRVALAKRAEWPRAP
jgi:hypothetical protein